MSERLTLQLDSIARSLDDIAPVSQAAEFVRDAAVQNCPTGWGELKGSIKAEAYDLDGDHVGEVFTNKEYAHYVELGTGPKGMADHAGISPNVSPVYTPQPWWIHESQIDAETAAKYHFHSIKTDQGRFYLCYGQAAQPYLYPALKDNVDTVLTILKDGYSKTMEGQK